MDARHSLEADLVARLRAGGFVLVTAESCTGGLIGTRITDVPGASECYLGGVVVYSDALKQRLLGVSEATLAAYGAVSEATAREMALGALSRLGGDCAIAVTGVAGPGGGTPEKPVGLVYAAASLGGEAAVEQFNFEGDRAAVRGQTADAALRMLGAMLA